MFTLTTYLNHLSEMGYFTGNSVKTHFQCERMFLSSSKTNIFGEWRTSAFRYTLSIKIFTEFNRLVHKMPVGCGTGNFEALRKTCHFL